MEVWLAGAADVELPRIVWGEGFRLLELKSAKSCLEIPKGQATPMDATAQKQCRGLFESQQKYRSYIERLFVRQWLLAEGVSVESHATPAFGMVSAQGGGDGFAVLKPHGDVSFHAEPRADKSGYTFEVDIPYSSFPPLNTQKLSELRLLVDVFSASPPEKREGPLSTTSPTR